MSVKIGSDWESTLARVAQLAGVAALVAVQPSRDAKLLALAQTLGALSGSTHAAQLAHAEQLASSGVTSAAARAPSRSRPKRKAKPRKK